MKDLERRRRAIEAIEAFVAGQLSNDDFDGVLLKLSGETMDHVLRTACGELWTVYDDTRTYRVSASDPLADGDRALLDLWARRLGGAS